MCVCVCACVCACVRACLCVCVFVCTCRLGTDVCTLKLIFVDKYIRISGFLLNESVEEMFLDGF